MPRACVGRALSDADECRSNGFRFIYDPSQQVPFNEIVDQVFDFAEKMLESQRQFAKNLVAVSASAAEGFGGHAITALMRLERAGAAT